MLGFDGLPFWAKCLLATAVLGFVVWLISRLRRGRTRAVQAAGKNVALEKWCLNWYYGVPRNESESPFQTNDPAAIAIVVDRILRQVPEDNVYYLHTLLQRCQSANPPRLPDVPENSKLNLEYRDRCEAIDQVCHYLSYGCFDEAALARSADFNASIGRV